MIVNECVHAYDSGFTTMAKDSVYRACPMTSEVIDSGGYHDNVTNNTRLTLGTGTWLVFGHPAWADPHVTTYGRLWKNGTTVGYEYNTDGFNAGPYSTGGPLCFWLETLGSGDYFEIATANDAGGSGSAHGQMVAIKVDSYSCMVGATGSSSASPVTFGTTLHDPQGMVTNSTTLTVKKAGYYLVLTVANGNGTSYITKNGTQLYGSYAYGQGAADYAAGFFNVGDTVQMISGTTFTYRQMAMAYMGPSYALVAYGHHSTDLANNSNFMSPVRFDSEWFDVGNSHPAGGVNIDPGTGIDLNSGKFNLLTGYHFGIGKISTDGGTFLQNDGCIIGKNGAGFGFTYTNNRHQRGSLNTTIAVAAFSANFNDYAGLYWGGSDTFIEALYMTKTNVFFTDVADYPYTPNTSFDKVVFPQ